MYSVSWEFSELDTLNKIFYGCVANVSFSISSTGAGNKKEDKCQDPMSFVFKARAMACFYFGKA
jgi:hypothetical protein